VIGAFVGAVGGAATVGGVVGETVVQPDVRAIGVVLVAFGKSVRTPTTFSPLCPWGYVDGHPSLSKSLAPAVRIPTMIPDGQHPPAMNTPLPLLPPN
jgi:hypothetical protein